MDGGTPRGCFPRVAIRPSIPHQQAHGTPAPPSIAELVFRDFHGDRLEIVCAPSRETLVDWGRHFALLWLRCGDPVQRGGERTSADYVDGLWCGVTYCAYIDFALSKSNAFFTVDADYGCGVIIKGENDVAREISALELQWRAIPCSSPAKFEFFVIHRKELLNLISVDEFREKMAAPAFVPSDGVLRDVATLPRETSLTASTGGSAWFDQCGERSLNVSKERHSLQCVAWVNCRASSDTRLSRSCALPDQIENEARKGETAVLEKTDARQGATTHVTRYVLVGGLVLVIIAFIIIYFVA